MTKHPRIEINKDVLKTFLSLLRKDDAVEMIDKCFSFEDMKVAIMYIFEQKNFNTNDRLEKFINKKSKS